MSRIARANVGDARITVLNDGAAEFPPEVFPELDQEGLDSLLKGAGKSAIQTNFNAFHVETPGVSMLVDTGAGGLFGPGAGFLQAALAEAGIEPGGVNLLVITHLHPDHIGGATKEDGTPAFENAELVLTETERQFWSDDGNFSGADDQTRQWRQLGLDMLAAYGDRVRTEDFGAEVAAGIHLEKLPGHTIGHAGVRIDSAGEQFLYVTDILHAQDLQLANPEICAAFDADREMAIATRKRTLDMLAADRIPFSGGHFLDRTIARVVKSGAGYKIEST